MRTVSLPLLFEYLTSRRPLSCLDNHGVLSPASVATKHRPRLLARPLLAPRSLGPSRGRAFSPLLAPGSVTLTCAGQGAAINSHGLLGLSTISGGTLGVWKRGCWVMECHEGGQQTARRCYYCCARREPFRFLPISLPPAPPPPPAHASLDERRWYVCLLICLYVFSFLSTQLKVYIYIRKYTYVPACISLHHFKND